MAIAGITRAEQVVVGQKGWPQVQFVPPPLPLPQVVQPGGLVPQVQLAGLLTPAGAANCATG